MADRDTPLLDRPPPETLDELYENAPCGYLTTNAGGTIVAVNATLSGMLNEKREHLIGQQIQTLLTPGARMFYETHCAPMLALHGVLKGISVDLKRTDGERLPALVDWRRVDDADGRVLGYRIMVISAVERVAYEQALLQERERARQQEAMVRELNADLELRVEARTAELVQMQKMESLGRLTGGVAHDFNNLLTPILITLDLLQSRFLTDERALRMAASAQAAAERARVMISRLLAFSRRQHLRAQAVNLRRMMDGMLGLLDQSIGPLVLLKTNIAADLPPARVDQTQLEIALLNLCVNARDAMPTGGTLTISANAVVKPDDSADLQAGAYIRLSVADTGSGMDPATLLRATEPFYSTKAIGKGTGLGLSMVHGLAAQSGGMLALDSSPGHGTTATIWLPVDVSAAAQAESTVLVPKLSEHRALSVLLVDDDDLVRFAAAEMLHDLGHTVVQANTADAALDLLKEFGSFDLMITDFLMPGMNGLELVKLVRASHPKLPVVLMTGYADSVELQGDALPRLAKPFGKNDLKPIVGRAMAPVGGERVSAERLETAALSDAEAAPHNLA